MNIESVITIGGKVVTYDDGTKVIITSGGFENIGMGCTFVLRCDTEGNWTQLSIPDAMPLLLDVMKQGLESAE